MGKEKELGIDRVYVVHAPVGYEYQAERLERILKEEYGFDYEFLPRDPVELIPEYFVPEIGETLSKGTILCTLNHIMLYRSIIGNVEEITSNISRRPAGRFRDIG